MSHRKATMGERVRAHVVLPKEMIEEIDCLVGKRERSRFIEDALEHRLILERQKQALSELRGMLDPADYPEWSTPEKVSEWVHNMRQEENRRQLEREARRLELYSE